MADKKVVIDITAKDETKKATKSVEKNMLSLGKTAQLVGGYFSASFGIEVARKFGETTAEMQRLNGMLKTATGSTKAASAAFDSLTEFATTTPFLLNDVVDAFVKMTNLGLDPSEAALTSYGNTATAMGKSLNQMIEAVADASTGEFERLKEFGIKSKSEGDNVTFTFKGIETTVKKSSEAISGYLKDIGETNFGGAMADQMDTINGAVSNLQGELNSLFTLNEGNANAITDWIKDLSFLVGEVNRAFADPTPVIRIGEISLEISKLQAQAKEIEDNPPSSKGWFGRDTDSTLSQLGLIEGQISRLKKEAAGLRAEADTPAEAAAAVTASPEDRNAAELADFEYREALREAELNDFMMIQEGMEEATLNRLRREREGEESLQLAKQQLWRDSASIGVDLINALFIFTGSKNKQLFELGKIASIAQATINTYQGATKALAQGGIWGGVGAAAVIANGLVQVARIKATTMSGGGGGGGGGGSIPTGGGPGAPGEIPQIPQAANTQNNGPNITIETVIGNETWVEDTLIPLMNDATDRGVTLNVRA